jgi:hypothetical protein
LPIVHLNGTSRKELLELRRTAAHSVFQAIDALSAMAPNGRDYYLVRGLFESARDQHSSRLAALDALYHELVAEAIALSDEEPFPGDSRQ